jgi:hypothetical protein
MADYGIFVLFTMQKYAALLPIHYLTCKEGPPKKSWQGILLIFWNIQVTVGMKQLGILIEKQCSLKINESWQNGWVWHIM